VRTAIWRAVFAQGRTPTTREMAAELGLPETCLGRCKSTAFVYRHARALARKRFIVITAPEKRGQPATLSLHPSKSFLKKP
jgi:hypothetical protein